MRNLPFLRAKPAGVTRDEALDLLAQIAERLERLLKTAQQTNRLLRHEGHANTKADLADDRAIDTHRRGRREADTPRRPSIKRAKGTRSRRGPSLHEEIAAVLSEVGRPMSLAELADKIQARGRFVRPRGSGPVTSNQVSSRVSNQQYRDQFVRRNGRISLAEA
jgi:hypothetical protein